MKKFLFFFSFLFFFNIGFTQNSSNFDRFTNFHVVLERATTTNDFISERIVLSATPTAAFFTIAVYLDTPFSGKIQYQIEEQPWKDLGRYHEANHPNREIFELVFLPNQTTNIRFKSSQAFPAELRVRWLALITTDQLQIPSTTLREDCACPQPAFCGRSCWCPSGNCPTDDTPVATAPSHIIVHHSASASTSDDFPAVVRSYWDFHVNINGWDDIGYNWLIDGEGVIYEGRGSGTRGAHFSCMNNQTTGICMIGNFEDSVPTPTAILALEDLIAWEACDKIILPKDSSNHITSGSLLAHISGHRDGNDLPNSCTNTVCPGENLYPLLSTIRQNVSDKACLNELVATKIFQETPFQIFPNPGNGQFQISGDLTQISTFRIFSQMGQETNFSFYPNGTLEIKDSGLFILKIIRKNGWITTHKLLVTTSN